MHKIAFFTGQGSLSMGLAIQRKYADVASVQIVLNREEKDIPDGIYCFQHDRDNKYEFLTKWQVDCAIVYGWPYKIPDAILCKVDFYNIHPSLLPKYRGPEPIPFQLLNDERTGGVTLHKINDRFDAGPICLQQRFSITAHDTMPAVNLKLTKAVLVLLEQFFIQLKDNILQFTEQDEEEATYYSYADMKCIAITSQTTQQELARIIRAFSGRFPVNVKYLGSEYLLDAVYESERKNAVPYNLADKVVYMGLSKL